MLGGAPITVIDEHTREQRVKAQKGNYASIIDSALVESGLADDWLETLSFGTDYAWAEAKGRRPVIYHSQPIVNNPSEVGNLVVTTGRIIDLINFDLTIETVDNFVEICLKHDINKVTIRAGLDPDIQPKIQGSLDRQLARRHGSRKAFLLRNSNEENYLLCVTN
jgi:hypothetical protein